MPLRVQDELIFWTFVTSQIIGIYSLISSVVGPNVTEERAFQCLYECMWYDFISHTLFMYVRGVFMRYFPGRSSVILAVSSLVTKQRVQIGCYMPVGRNRIISTRGWKSAFYVDYQVRKMRITNLLSGNIYNVLYYVNRNNITNGCLPKVHLAHFRMIQIHQNQMKNYKQGSASLFITDQNFDLN